MTQEDTATFPWLSVDYVKLIISSDCACRRTAGIMAYFCQTLTLDGNEYGSNLFRVIIEHLPMKYMDDDSEEPEKRSYIVKLIQSHPPAAADVIKKYKTYEKELEIHRKTLRLMETVHCMAGSKIQFAPKYICSTKTPYETVVFEDLQSNYGYKVVNPMNGMNVEHAKLVLILLAKMHAASMCLNAKDFSYRKNFVPEEFAEAMPEYLKTVFRNKINDCVEILKEYPDGEKYVEIYKNFNDSFYNDIVEFTKLIKHDNTDFNVLNHGDLWSKNILFRYDKNDKPIDVKFFDFQLVNFGSPGYDLNYFSLSSLSEETRDNDWKELLGTYHDMLVKTLEAMKYESNMPTLDDVINQTLKAKCVALMVPCVILPIAKYDADDTYPKDMTNKTCKLRKTKYRQSLINTLKHLERSGYFN